ncbi:MAG TPA: family 16 glycoside hydrolase [Opitutaceae bacterium]|jgi:catechol 2,3-dioxygenase-like lactoylglutathione lyase family enzyme|nr:family 16 glycoside hydrolase [Opitutaceae bacterium]
MNLPPRLLVCAAVIAISLGASRLSANPILVTGISGATFLTTDPDALKRFYGAGAGFTESVHSPETYFFKVGDSQWLEFKRVKSYEGSRRLQYVTLGTNNIDETQKELSDRGVAAHWVVGAPGIRILELEDPAGDRIHIEETSPAPLGGPPSHAFSDHLQHVGFAVDRSKLAETAAFYRDKLGLAEAVRMNNDDGRLGLIKFRVPGPGRDLIELIFHDPPLNKWAAGAYDHINFEVANIDDTYRVLHYHGIATQARHYPEVNGEHLWAMNLFDPELTRVEIQVIPPTTVPVGTVSTVDATSLFDGKTLTGWEGNLGNWRIEDGAIVAGHLDAKQPHNEFLASTRDFGNFELILRYKIEGTGPLVNGGVQFWSQRIPSGFEMSGYQADLGAILGANTDGNLYDESRRAKNLAVVPEDVRARALKPGEWNDYRIRAVGPRIQIWLNGIKTVDYIETDPSIPLHGRLGLQIHGGANTKVSYRDLTIQAIP